MRASKKVAGDREADFRAWVIQNRTRLRTTAYLLCGDWFLADDLVQDALGRLFCRWDRVSASGDPRPYVNRILCNLNTDYQRRPARREVSQRDVSEALPHPHTTIVEQDDDLISALHALPARQRTVLVLRFFEDYSVAQTAALIKTSPGNVKSQTSRGLEALRSALELQRSSIEGVS